MALCLWTCGRVQATRAAGWGLSRHRAWPSNRTGADAAAEHLVVSGASGRPVARELNGAMLVLGEVESFELTHVPCWSNRGAVPHNGLRLW